MRRICITVLILLFTGAGFMSSCSTERSKEKVEAIKGKKSPAEESFEEEPKAPASALNGGGEGQRFTEEHGSSFE